MLGLQGVIYNSVLLAVFLYLVAPGSCIRFLGVKLEAVAACSIPSLVLA